LDVLIHGSGFNRKECNSGWNLNYIAKQPGSLIRYLGSYPLIEEPVKRAVRGVTDPFFMLACCFPLSVGTMKIII